MINFFLQPFIIDVTIGLKHFSFYKYNVSFPFSLSFFLSLCVSVFNLLKFSFTIDTK